MTPVERVARAICARSSGGFCSDVGGRLGCKVGRGVAPHWSACAATQGQLHLSGLMAAASDALAAMREPSEGMVEAGWQYANEIGPTVLGVITDSTCQQTYTAMIDKALEER